MSALLLLLSRSVSDSPTFQAISFSVIHGAIVFIASISGLTLHDQLVDLRWGTAGSLNLTLGSFILIPAWTVSGWLCFRTSREVYGVPCTSTFWVCLLCGWLMTGVVLIIADALFLRPFLMISLNALRAQGGDVNQLRDDLAAMLRTLMFVVLGAHAVSYALLTYPLAWWKITESFRT